MADSKRVLITYGGWEGHEPELTAKRFERLLSEKGCAVTMSTSLDDLTDGEKLKAGFDLIVVNWTMSEISGDQMKGLGEAVGAGVGIGGWHGGAGDAFRKQCHFQYIIGGQFVAHPGNIKDYTVEIADGDHEITRGLKGFAMKSEQYYMHIDPAVHVLATTVVNQPTDAWVEGTVMPVAWTKRHSEGKVFYCSQGHKDADFDFAPEAQELTLRGLLWAAR